MVILINQHLIRAGGVNYSLEEHIIGTWIDGSTLYEVTVDFGALPNNTFKEVDMFNYDISVVSITGKASNGEYTIALPFSGIDDNTIQVMYEDLKRKLWVMTNADQSAFYTYFTIQYIKV